jgi:hypothetical protein
VRTLPRTSLIRISWAIIALTTTTRIGQASDPKITAPLVVVFDASAADLLQKAIRAAVGQELERPVRADADPSAATLSIGRDAEGSLVIRYRPSSGELAETVSVADASGDTVRQVASAAKRLVTGAGDAGLPPSPSSENRSATGVSRSTPANEQIDAPPSSLYVRLSGALGFGNATYDYRFASGVGRFASANTGPLASVHAAVGHRGASGVAVGGELGAVGNGPLTKYGNLGGYRLGPFALRLQLGPFVDYYPNARGRLHLQAGVGVAYNLFQVAVAACGQQCNGGFDPSTDGVPGKSLWGGAGYLGIGYDFGGRPGGAGLFARTSLGYFADERTTMLPLELSLGATMAWF